MSGSTPYAVKSNAAYDGTATPHPDVSIGSGVDVAIAPEDLENLDEEGLRKAFEKQKENWISQEEVIKKYNELAEVIAEIKGRRRISEEKYTQLLQRMI